MPDSTEVAVESAPDRDAAIWDAPADSAPDTASPAPQAVPADPATKSRDDQGRVASPDQAPPTSAPDTPDPESPPAESTDEQPPAEAVADVPATEEAEAVYPEFEYTVNGRALNIPGSKVGDDGLFIPATQQEQTARLLIAGRMAEQQRRNHGRELQAARAEGQVEVQKARRVLAAFGELTKNKEQYLAFGENLEKNRETLMLRAELDAVKAEKETVGKQWTEHQQTQAAEALVPQLKDGLKTIIGQQAKKPEFAGVDTAKLYERIMQRHFDQVFSEDESGEILIDQGFIEDEMQYEAAAVARGRDATTTQAALKKENAARQGQSGTKPPPMVGTGKGSQPAGTKPKTYKSTRDADADIWG